MKINKLVIIAFVIGFFIACVSLAVSGFDTRNSVTITCSADGKYVYMADNSHFYKSEDFGESWKITIADVLNP